MKNVVFVAPYFMIEAVMPSGVEHLSDREPPSASRDVIEAVMPSGVEHVGAGTHTYVYRVSVIEAVMPSGVEHLMTSARRIMTMTPMVIEAVMPSDVECPSNAKKRPPIRVGETKNRLNICITNRKLFCW